MNPDNLLLFKQNCQFIMGARQFETIPNFNLSEIAFWGKSNSGKSSLTNALVHRVNLVKVAKTPGKTKEINFFNLNQQLIIADLPGYGYAKVAQTVKAEWYEIIVLYLHNRLALKRVYLLIDSRHGLKKLDFEIMEFLDSIPKSYVIILTKADKLNKQEQQKVAKELESCLVKHPAAYPTPFIVSSKSKFGLDELRKNIIDII